MTNVFDEARAKALRRALAADALAASASKIGSEQEAQAARALRDRLRREHRISDEEFESARPSTRRRPEAKPQSAASWRPPAPPTWWTFTMGFEGAQEFRDRDAAERAASEKRRRDFEEAQRQEAERRARERTAQRRAWDAAVQAAAEAKLFPDVVERGGGARVDVRALTPKELLHRLAKLEREGETWHPLYGRLCAEARRRRLLVRAHPDDGPS